MRRQLTGIRQSGAARRVLVAIAVFTVAVGVGFLVRAGVEALTRRLVSDYDSTTVVGERSGVLASLTTGLVGAGYL